MRISGTRVGAFTLCISVGSVALAACGASDETPSDLCKAVANLESGVEQIQQDPVARSTLSAIEESLTKIKANVQTLSDTASSEFPTEVDTVEADADALDKSVAAATENPSQEAVNAVRAAASSFATSVEDLSDAASSDC